MTEKHIKKAKEYAMSRTYPRFDSIFISNFVQREIEGAYLEGVKETENLEYKIKDVQRALNKKITNLEKLKSDFRICEKNADTYYDQLTKAKEIIKELLDTQYQLDPYRDVFKTRVLKAEQFLKEIEK